MRKFIREKYRDVEESIYATDYSSIYDDFINFGVGDPDLRTDEIIIKEAYDSQMAGHTHYADPQGYIKFREAIAKLYEEDFGVKCDPKEILITMSGTEAMLLILQAIINKGDEVIVPSPYFSVYPDQIEMAGGKTVFYDTKFENDFEIIPNELEKLINKNTKAIIINTPNNPTGAVYTDECLKEIYELAVKHDILVICDDIYTIYSYESKFSPMIKYDKNFERVISISSMSKDFVMTGWRLGAIVAHEDLIKAVNAIHTNTVYAVPTICQYAGVIGIENRKKICPALYNEYKERMYLAYERLKKLKYVEVMKPKGTFYIFPKINVPGMTTKEVVKEILEKAHVNLIDGKVFGDAGEGFIRIAVTVNKDKINEAFDRIENLDIFKK